MRNLTDDEKENLEEMLKKVSQIFAEEEIEEDKETNEE